MYKSLFSASDEVRFPFAQLPNCSSIIFSQIMVLREKSLEKLIAKARLCGELLISKHRERTRPLQGKRSVSPAIASH